MTERVKFSEGDSVILHTNTVIQSNDVIKWRWSEDGSKSDLIAKLDRDSISFFNVSDGIFSDKLKINNQTGDLTIIDISFNIFGEYYLQIIGEKTTRYTFKIESEYTEDFQNNNRLIHEIQHLNLSLLKCLGFYYITLFIWKTLLEDKAESVKHFVDMLNNTKVKTSKNYSY